MSPRTLLNLTLALTFSAAHAESIPSETLRFQSELTTLEKASIEANVERFRKEFETLSFEQKKAFINEVDANLEPLQAELSRQFVQAKKVAIVSDDDSRVLVPTRLFVAGGVAMAAAYLAFEFKWRTSKYLSDKTEEGAKKFRNQIPRLMGKIAFTAGSISIGSFILGALSLSQQEGTLMTLKDARETVEAINATRTKIAVRKAKIEALGANKG